MVADEEAKNFHELLISWKYANSRFPRRSMREPLRKFGTNLLQVKVRLFGVRLVARVVGDAAGV